MTGEITVCGARENNLKNIDVAIPRNKFVVFTGVSGSGKSSLAFGTIFAEGQRRFMESLSSYARMFLGQMQKPDVDRIDGLSPAISIDQKTTNHNPRSTVGTVTEIYDYLRLLYSRIGTAHCPKCGKVVTRQSTDQIIEQIFEAFNEKPITIEAPVASGQKGRFEKEFEEYKRSGFVRVKVDGNLWTLDEEIVLDKNIKHTISVVIDRLKVEDEERTRINDGIETALRLTNGLVTVTCDGEERTFSDKFACIDCGISIAELEPRNFSFNSPFGACPHCNGLGFTTRIDPDLVIPNKDLSLTEGAVRATGWNAESGKIAQMTFRSLGKALDFDINAPVKDLPDELVKKILYGMDGKIRYEYKFEGMESNYNGRYEGIIPNLMRRFRETTSEWSKAEIAKLMVQNVCEDCHGKKLKPEVLAVTVAGKNIYELTSMPIDKTMEMLDKLKLSGEKSVTAEPILKEIKARCQFLIDVGLHYLTLSREAATLSGGESQRIRLATQIGSGLVGVLYILDEPSIGLHQRDNAKLLATLTHLRDLGNTLIVVEHDEETIRHADYIVDVGPYAGRHGGEVVACGTVADIIKSPKSVTGAFLSGKEKIDIPAGRREKTDKYIKVVGARENNLQNITVEFPVGVLTAVTGVSGSGKSSLVNRVLSAALTEKLSGGDAIVAKYKGISGCEYIDKVIDINQSPIGRTPRSNPATYTGVWTLIRELFASTRDAKERGFAQGRFSFNVRGGRCENCEGDGTKKIEMHFLPDIYVKCEVCNGKRFNKETLSVKYKGKSIWDILEMTVDEAVIFFGAIPRILTKIKTLQDVGLGYIKLGQPATELSGGEAQRVKLATELARASTGKTLYILDEPTTGLSAYDVKKLIAILNRLVGSGNTIIVIEHNLDIIKIADHIIDLGPDGGVGGGTVVATGTPEEVAAIPESYTGQFLKKIL
jgi:excinuclease ABC subunit A